MKKRLAAVCIAIITAFSGIPGFSYESEAENTALEKLFALDILDENGDFIYEKNIMRETFVTAVAACIQNGSFAAVENPFSDVDEKDASYSAIMTALSAGVINADETFRPVDEITADEAGTILVRLLGYDVMAQKKGGFPAGYRNVINDLKLFKGCGSLAGGITADDFAKILVNVLETPVFEVDAVSKKNEILQLDYKEGNLFMNKAMDVYSDTGIVESNENASLYGDTSVGENQILLNKTVFEAEPAAADFLGIYSEIYYHYDKATDERKILWIGSYKDKNTIKEFTSCDVESANNLEIKYRNAAGKTEKLDISGNESFYFNGVLSVYNKSLIEDGFAQIKWIDNDGDAVADAVFVYRYDTAVAARISQNGKMIYDMFGGQAIELDEENSDYSFDIFKNGKRIAFEDIKSGDVISYAYSTDAANRLRRIVVSSKTAEGEIETLDLSNETAVINGEEYSIDKDLVSQLKIGENGTYYIDFAGRIAKRQIKKDIVYGYLNAMAKKGIKDTVEMKIFTENNRWVVLPANSKIKVNGEKIDDYEFYDDFVPNPTDTSYRQLIRYSVNQDGAVTAIETAKSYEKWSDSEKTAAEADIFRKLDVISEASYRDALMSFDNLLSITGETKIFAIPKQNAGETASDDDFYIIAPGKLVADTKYQNITAYDCNSVMQAAACTMDAKYQVNRTSELFVVNKIKNGQTDSGNDSYMLVGAYRGIEKINLLTASKEVLEDDDGNLKVGKGDALQVEFDRDGLIACVDIKYDYSDTAKRKDMSPYLYSNYTKVAGKVFRTNTEKSLCIIDYGVADYGIFHMNKLKNVYIYDSADGEITLGTAADIEEGLYIAAIVKNYSITEIVVYK